MTGRVFALILCAALLTTALTGCGTPAQAEAGAKDLMEDVMPIKSRDAGEPTDFASKAAADFTVELFKNTVTGGENAMVSPLSVLFALGMTSGGAAGETLEQMEAAFGLDSRVLADYLLALRESLTDGEKYKLSAANSIWLRDEGFSANADFLQKNADYYAADVFTTPFDAGTVTAINTWVGEKTEGMIERIIDEARGDTVMMLINALCFEAEWQKTYSLESVREGRFTTEAGLERTAEMMYGEESRYLDDGRAAGFIKDYAGGKYAFAALLPNEGLSLADYISSLSGAGLSETLENAQSCVVHTAMPKFTSDYGVELSDALKAMGMTDAFDGGLADFSGIGESATGGNIYIGAVLHKTHIAVDELGTKAGAVTAVDMRLTSAIDPSSIKTVTLDRPFVYMIIDTATNLPIFIGALTDSL